KSLNHFMRQTWNTRIFQIDWDSSIGSFGQTIRHILLRDQVALILEISDNGSDLLNPATIAQSFGKQINQMFGCYLWPLSQLTKIHSFGKTDSRSFDELLIAISPSGYNGSAEVFPQFTFALVFADKFFVTILRQHSEIEANFAEAFISVINSEFEPLLGAG